MKRIIILLALVALCACNSENIRIKRALKESVTEVERKDYKLKEFQVIETILKDNLQDSIWRMKSQISSLQIKMHFDSSQLLNAQSNLRQCQYDKARAPYHIGYMYNSLIRDWEKMVADHTEKLEKHAAEKSVCQEKITRYESAIEESDSPIVYYKIRHTYKVKSSLRETIVTLDSKYNVVKF